MDRGAWQATVLGVSRVGHNLSTKPPPPAITFILESLSTGGQTAAVSLGPTTSEWHAWRGVEAPCCLSTPCSGHLIHLAPPALPRFILNQ